MPKMSTAIIPTSSNAMRFWTSSAMRESKYLTSDFIEACQLDHSGSRQLSPEPGLAYIAYRKGCFSASILGQLPWTRGARLLVGTLDERIAGERAYVPPIAMHNVPSHLVRDLLLGELKFVTLIDIGFVEKELGARGIQLDQFHETEYGGMWTIRANGNSEIELMLSPRRLECVLFGLLSLRSAIEVMAAATLTVMHSGFDLE